MTRNDRINDGRGEGLKYTAERMGGERLDAVRQHLKTERQVGTGQRHPAFLLFEEFQA